MSAENPRYFKWYPTEETDLGTMPFEGDFTIHDRIIQYDVAGFSKIYSYNSNTNEFGRLVMIKVGGRPRQVWQAGVTVGPVTYEGTPMPVWIIYCGDGACALKVPAELEEVQT